MEERPRTAEDVEDIEGDEVAAEEPGSGNGRAIEFEASRSDAPPMDDTGIVRALSESAPQVEPEEEPAHAAAEPAPVEAAAESSADPEEPAEEGAKAEPEPVETSRAVEVLDSPVAWAAGNVPAADATVCV
jgi:hypothetical protein